MEFLTIKVKPHGVVDVVANLTEATVEVKPTNKFAESMFGTRETDAFTCSELRAIGEMLISYADCYEEDEIKYE